MHSIRLRKVNSILSFLKAFFPPARLGTFGKSLLSEWAESFHIYPKETWLWFLRPHPRDDLFPSSTSSEGQKHSINSQMLLKQTYEKINNVNRTKNVAVGESIKIRQHSQTFWTKCEMWSTALECSGAPWRILKPNRTGYLVPFFEWLRKSYRQCVSSPRFTSTEPGFITRAGPEQVLNLTFKRFQPPSVCR